MKKDNIKNLGNWLKRKVIWLLIAVSVTNLFSFVAPKKAYATDQIRYPSGDIASSGTWSVFPAAPTTKWDKVSEVGAHDSDTTYLLHGTTAGYAMFSFSAFSVPPDATIQDLTVSFYSRDNTSGTNKAQPAIRVNSTNYLTTSTSTNVPTSYGIISFAYATNPNTGSAWTVADINGTGAAPLQGFGVNSADANPQIRFTQVYAEVNYTRMAVTTDKSDYPVSGETITATSTLYNYLSANLTNTTVDYVVFIDNNADNQPTAGETYVTAGCVGSGVWAAGNYSMQSTGINVNQDSNTVDNQACVNTNFPSNTTYNIWSKWYASGGSPIYATDYATFTSVPTLTEILFLSLVGGGVYLAVKSGVIKLKPAFVSGDKGQGATDLPLNNDPSKENGVVLSRSKQQRKNLNVKMQLTAKETQEQNNDKNI